MNEDSLPRQADRLLARVRRLLSDHKKRAKKDGVSLDYGIEELTALLATNPRCAYCENLLTFEVSLDHRHAIARGGKQALANLAACCRHCNSLKGQLNEEEFCLLRGTLDKLPYEGRMDIERRLMAGGTRYLSRKRS